MEIVCKGCGTTLSKKMDKCPCCGKDLYYNENELPAPMNSIRGIQSIGQSSAKSNSIVIPDGFWKVVHCSILEREGVAVCSYSNRNEKELTVPAVINGKPVLEIFRGTFQNNLYLQHINIPPSVVRISESAFEGCINLKIVTGCEGLYYIGKNAFKGCINLVPDCDLVTRRFGSETSSFAGCYHLPLRMG